MGTETKELKKLFIPHIVRQHLEIESDLHLPLDSVVKFRDEAGMVGFMPVFEEIEPCIAMLKDHGMPEDSFFIMQTDPETWDKNSKMYD